VAVVAVVAVVEEEVGEVVVAGEIVGGPTADEVVVEEDVEEQVKEFGSSGRHLEPLRAISSH
jgi:hypothetical protein